MEQRLAELTRIESPSTDGESVARLARRIAEELEPLGLAVELLPVEGAGPVLRARRGTRPVMLLGHLDTVWDVGTVAQRPVRIENGRSEEHTSELQSLTNLVCRLLLLKT